MLHSPSKSLQFGEIKNKRLEVIQTPPNPFPSFLKKHSNKVIKLLFFPLLYSPSFPQHPNIALRVGRWAWRVGELMDRRIAWLKRWWFKSMVKWMPGLLEEGRWARLGWQGIRFGEIGDEIGWILIFGDKEFLFLYTIRNIYNNKLC